LLFLLQIYTICKCSFFILSSDADATVKAVLQSAQVEFHSYQTAGLFSSADNSDAGLAKPHKHRTKLFQHITSSAKGFGKASDQTLPLVNIQISAG
jgi:hypothetical protein